MDKYLSKDKIKVLLQNAPKNLDQGKIIKSWVDQGYTLEGFKEQTQPVEAKKPGLFDRIKTDIAQRGSNVADIQNAPIEGGTNLQQSQSLLGKGVKVASEGFGAVTDVAGDVLRSTFGDKPVDAVKGTIEKGFTGVTNALGDTPLFREAAQYEDQTKGIENTLGIFADAGNIAGTIDAAGGIAKGVTATTRLAGKGAKSVVDSLKVTPEKLATNTRSSFQSNLDKALPPLKNDVRNLGKRYSNAETAFKDIVQNKDSLGLIDDAGNPRLPKDFTETVQAQQARLKDIYKGYTSKLGEVDAPKFEADISSKIKSKVSDIGEQLKKENSLDGRKALTKIQKELSTLRDTSPEGIQKYIEDIGQRTKTSPGAPMTIEQARLANLAGDMKTILDDSISKLDGQGYAELRGKYAAHKALQDQLLRASAKELRDTPGLMEKASNVGLTVEGLNFLLTQNPAAIVTGLGFKGATAFAKWLKSPTRALKNAFSDVESGYLKDVSPQTTIPTATNAKNAISKTVTPKVPKEKGFIQSAVDNLKNPNNAQGGFINLGGKKMTIHPEDLAEMSDFTDFVAGETKPKNLADYKYNIREMAKRYNIPANVSDKVLRNKFSKILEQANFKR